MYGICVLIFLLAIINNSVSVTKSCEVMIEFYKILGCRPINNSMTDLCQSSFKCPEKFDSDKCYFLGKTYSIGEILPDNFTEPLCEFDCECRKGFDGLASFECSEDCGCDEPYNNTCIAQFDSPQSCCSDKDVCDRAEIAKLQKCYLEGNSYYLGQQMHAANDCYTCLCTNDFDNATSFSKNSNCIKVKCEAYVIYRSDRLWHGCAPVFIEPFCCVGEFKCPNENDKIDSKTIVESDGPTCKFGNLTLRRGEELEHELNTYYDTSCKCEIPPILT